MSNSDTEDAIFVARQPILDNRMRVVGYELLYRSGGENRNNAIDGDAATTEVLINSVLGIGFERLVGDQPAYFNVTTGFIRGERPLPLDTSQAVLEILEDVEIEDAIVSSIKQLRNQGFTIALDDFRYSEDAAPLLAIADIVKVEVMGRDRDELRRDVERLQPYNVTLLAEKVETYAEFQTCEELGFSLFQGFFFAKPHIMQGRSVANNRLVILNLIARLQDPQVELPDLEELIVQDVALTYRLLRYINSPPFGMTRTVETVSRALALIGADRIRNWATLLLMTRIDDKPAELMRTALVRACMAQILASEFNGDQNAQQAFTCALLSVVDALMDRPMEELVADLPLSDDVRDALRAHQGPLGNILATTVGYEQGRWQQIAQDTRAIPQLARCYLRSLEWADGVMESLGQVG